MDGSKKNLFIENDDRTRIDEQQVEMEEEPMQLANQYIWEIQRTQVDNVLSSSTQQTQQTQFVLQARSDIYLNPTACRWASQYPRRRTVHESNKPSTRWEPI